jgi:arylsulfatase A-like enzyme/tetratricopeptide (TPR) repeat protein
MRNLGPCLISVIALSSAIGGWTLAACRRPAQAANSQLHSGALRGANVLVVTIDTLRADRVGVFGGARPTPTMDRLATGGLRFTRAYAHAPMTLPTHASILTGLTPPRHGVRVNGSELDASVPTLAELLGRSGYRTGAFVGSFVLDARFGLSRGFGVYDDRVGTEHGPVTFGFVERSADRVLRAAADWLLQPDADGGSPWFAWVHLFDPHTPYRAPRTVVDSAYDNEVAFVDAELGSFLEELGKAGLLARTLIVVLADHGEGLGDHGEETHGLFAYDSTIRIPLIINGPGLYPAIVTGLAGQADLLPTIADLVGIEPYAGLDGRSLLPAIRGEAAGSEAVYFEALDAHLNRNWAPLTGIVSGGWKYIDLPILELFDLSRDPGEQSNRAAEERARTTGLARRLEDWKRAKGPRAAPEPDPDTVAKLRSLGYTSSAAPVRKAQYSEADDPKRLVDVDRRFQTALHLVGDGRHADAAGLLREAIDRRPDFTAAYLALASVYIESGHAREAVDLLRAAGRRGLSDPKLQERLGAAWLATGEPARAAAALEPLTGDGASVDTLNTLAIVRAEMGDRDRARGLFERALAKAPRGASIWYNLGLLELAARRPPEAAQAFERAVDADPAFAPAWAALGAAYVTSDRARAIGAWTRAVDLSPGDYDTLFNLGMLLWQSGRRDEARPYLERFVRDAPPSRYSADAADIRRMLAGRADGRPSR